MDDGSFKISLVALKLFSTADIDPAAEFAEVSRWIGKWTRDFSFLSRYHYRNVTEATGFALSWVSRKGRALLNCVEGADRSWRYEEHGIRNVSIIVNQPIPMTLAQHLIGEPIEKLIDLDLVSGARIEEVEVSDRNTRVKLKVDWCLVDRLAEI